jgi:hypothetical protein
MADYALSEFKAAGWIDENGKCADEMQAEMCKDALTLLGTMGKQGHSGSSFPYLMNLLNRVAYFKPLTPLTGEQDEWNDVSECSGEPLWQNKRYSSIFKRADGTAYCIDAIVFRDKDGDCYTGSGSSIDITFPYTVPDKPEYRDDPEEE